MINDHQRLPVSTKAALEDMKWYLKNKPTTREAEGEVLRAARTLAIVVEQVKELTPSRIGVDEFLAACTDYEGYSFHRGAQFALDKVRATLTSGDRSDD